MIDGIDSRLETANIATMSRTWFAEDRTKDSGGRFMAISLQLVEEKKLYRRGATG